MIAFFNKVTNLLSDGPEIGAIYCNDDFIVHVPAVEDIPAYWRDTLLDLQVEGWSGYPEALGANIESYKSCEGNDKTAAVFFGKIIFCPDAFPTGRMFSQRPLPLLVGNRRSQVMVGRDIDAETTLSGFLLHEFLHYATRPPAPLPAHYSPPALEGESP